LGNGRRICLLAEGRLVNLAAGDGHPAEIMDMSFAIQALSARWLCENRGKAAPGELIFVPEEVDKKVAQLALEFAGTHIDKLTPEQEAYLNA
ncbi:MAG: adenosylhomocysteinase, partial [Firmicutes bacterium]|nr:adenosylhomocysteinase [Bacillota bacterium]